MWTSILYKCPDCILCKLQCYNVGTVSILSILCSSKCVRKIQMTSPQCKTECHAWNTHVRQTGSSTSTPCVGYETRINVSSGRGTCSLIKSTNNDSECPPGAIAPANSYLVQGNYVATYNHMICAYASRHNVPVTDGYRCYVICVGGNCPTISECP